ncbi:hypothetical protein ASPCAL02276 [Aspergillus calidoustus]|uniref:DUF1993 domain-containing protein n=1 Tax=Aspergillus calidoustus TaxID=454130 RepID=A0A0U5GMF9_ASPCI|nr:hypothetical protein ASPCAL02276 [Aspergillus calidoustus]
MPSTTYDSTIPVCTSILRTLTHILQKAIATTPNPDSLLSARLHETMYPLADQIRLATQYTENLAARLSGRDATQFGGNPSSFSESFERINAVLESLSKAEKNIVNENAEKVAPTPVGPGVTVDMSGASYAHSIVLPNVYFHLGTAYGILRKEGVEIGKRDWYEGWFPRE